jgi:hypothetical protein
MWKSDKQESMLALRPRTLLLVTAAILLMPMAAIAGIVGKDDDKAARKPAVYNLRCWQDGKLILEENYVTLPPQFAASSMKLQGVDRHNQPIYVTETKNATCLVRARFEREKPVTP